MIRPSYLAGYNRCSALLKLVLTAGLLILAGCQDELYTDLDQQSANHMIAVLKRDGIAASRELVADGRYRVMVDETEFGRALELLDREGLPEQQFVTMGEVFEKDGLLSSPTEERARMLYALNQELAMTISEIKGVISARIHVVLPERKPLSGEDSASSAAVFIRHRSDLNIRELVPHIKKLVSNSIPDLTYSKVSVVNVIEDDGVADMPTAADLPAHEAIAGVRVLKEDAGKAQLWLIAGSVFFVATLLSNAVWLFFWYRRGSIVVQLPPTMLAALGRGKEAR